METPVQKTISCIACNQVARPAFSKRGFSYYRCPSCQLVSVHPVPADTSNIYTREYFSGATHGFGYVDYEADKEPLRAVFASYLETLQNLIGHKGTLLDVGAASGFFVQLARSAGWDASGVEVSSYAVDHAQARGIPLTCGTLEQYVGEPGSVDVITMWDVFEHLPEPHRLLQKAHTLLRPGGFLALTSPDASSWYARLMGKRWHLYIPPEHIHHYTHASFASIVRQHGFQLVEYGVAKKQFTIPYIFHTAQHWTGISLLGTLGNFIAQTPLARLAIPLNFRDNFFAIVRKT